MAKLLVKNKETGEIRPMTKSSFDLVGHKRGFIVVGNEPEESKPDPVKDEIARRKAEKAAKEAAEKEEHNQDEPEQKPEEEKPKRGRKPKESAE